VGREEAYTPPEQVDLLAAVATFEGPPEDRGEATLRVRTGAAAGLRRRAAPVVAPRDGEDGWDTLALRYSDPDSLARRLAGYADDVVVIGPPDVRDAVVRHLRAVAGVGR
jgi:predicted DNA-binding transcriptional regulator YafY